MFTQALESPVQLRANSARTAQNWRARLYAFVEAVRGDPGAFPLLAIRAPQMHTSITGSTLTVGFHNTE